MNAANQQANRRFEMVGLFLRIRRGVSAIVISAATLTGCSSSQAERHPPADGNFEPTQAAPTKYSSLLESPGATPPITPKSTCDYRKDDSGAPAKFVGIPPTEPPPAAKSAKTMKLLTNQGTIVIRLDPTAAPCTVNSFYFLSKKNFFDNTVCHRLATLRSDRLDLLQCGDPLAGHHAKNDSDGSGGPGYLFNDENLGPAYKRGVVFMAHNAGIAHSNGSQFVISYSDETARLQKDYTPFGVVIEGLNVVDKIAAGGISAKKGEADIYLDGDGSNAPKMRVVIEDVTVE